MWLYVSLVRSLSQGRCFVDDEHVEVEATWGYRRMGAAYREPDRAQGEKLM
jgi:hypothetical protein